MNEGKKKYDEARTMARKIGIKKKKKKLKKRKLLFFLEIKIQ